MAPPALINIIGLVSLLLTTSSSYATNPNYETFLQCFLHQSNSSSLQIIYTPNITSYNTVLKSSAQNLRYLYSPAAKKPQLIITPQTEPQVQASVVCSRKNGLHIRVRSGGHDYEGMSFVSETDQFIIVDMSKLRSISIDEKHNTAWVQAGATLGELYYAIAKKSNTLAFTAGFCATVGIGGHLSGGGIGTISRKYGIAADHIIDAVVVDAEGGLLKRETMGEDYFWAIRGGGAASFGVVVSFKISLVSVPPIVSVFSLNRTLSTNVAELITKWQYVSPHIVENIYINVHIHASPGGKTVEVIFNSLYLGRCTQLQTMMKRSFPELGLEANDCNEMSWLNSVVYFASLKTSTDNTTAESLLDRTPMNVFFKAKSDFATKPITETEWKKILNFVVEAEAQPVTLILEPFGGKYDEIQEMAVPFPHRAGKLYIIQYLTVWSEVDVAVAEMHLSWMKKLYEFMTPFVSSQQRAAYVNFKDTDLGKSRGRHTSYEKTRIWGEKYFNNNFRRLALVKAIVDADNFFWNEQSIPPLLHDWE